MEPRSPVVLVVEDETDLRETLRDVIEDSGRTVATAANGREAVALLEAGQRPRLIVLDLMMPVMNGWDFLSWLARQPAPLSQIPVLVISAAAVDTVRTVDSVYGFAVAIAKPVQLPALLGAIDRLC